VESLEHLHSQLGGLEDLRTIVKTMKSLSAASIHQYELAVTALAGYYRTVKLGLNVVIRESEKPPLPHRHRHALPRLAAVVFGSDHGLCGRFNEEISTHALQRMAATPADSQTRLLLAVGARVQASLEQQDQAVEDNFQLPGSASQITATVQQILLKIDDWREQQGVHYVYLFYNRRSGNQGYRPSGIELLPVDLYRFHRLATMPWPSRRLPTFTMERAALFSRLLRQYFFVTISRACAESQASEHASRLSAMQSAERNLNDRIEQVTMACRRARQDAITAELLDVVTGFEAILGDDV